MKQRTAMGLIILMIILVVGVAAESSGSGILENIQGVSQEIGLPQEPTIPEETLIPGELGFEPYINGTGNLTKIVEISNSSGGYARAALNVVGGNFTSWGYRMMSRNESGNCMVVANISVHSAEQVSLYGISNTTRGDVAYTVTSSESLDGIGFYSGEVVFLARSTDTDSVATITAWNEEGSTDHLTRAYNYTGNSSQQPVNPREIPIPDRISGMHERNDTRGLMFYDQYAGSFTTVDQGTINTYNSVSGSGLGGAKTYHTMNLGPCEEMVSNIFCEDWPVGHLVEQGSGSYAFFAAMQVKSLKYSAIGEFFRGNSSAFQKTDALAKRIYFRVDDCNDQSARPQTMGSIEGKAGAGEIKPGGSGLMTVPASFNGWVWGVNSNNICKISENYTIRGAYVRRLGEGGKYPEVNSPILLNGIKTNITAGREGMPPGSSELQGMGLLIVDGSEADPTNLKGRWIASSPAGIPITREVRALMPGNEASSTSSTMTGQRNIMEEGYYRSGMVDVS